MILIWDYVRLSVCLTRYDKVYSPNDSVMVSYVNEYAYHQNFFTASYGHQSSFYPDGGVYD